MAKRYGQGSEMLVFLRHKRQENGTERENYGGSKTSTTDSSAVLFLVPKGPLGKGEAFRTDILWNSGGGSFTRMSRVKNFVQALEALEKHALGTDIHDPNKS